MVQEPSCECMTCQTLQSQVQELTASSTLLQAEVQELKAAVAKLQTSATEWTTGTWWAAHWMKEWLSLKESFDSIWGATEDRSDLLATMHQDSERDTKMLTDLLNGVTVNGRQLAGP